MKYRVIYEYEFHRGTIATEPAWRANNVYDGRVVKENTVCFWFLKKSQLVAGCGVNDKTVLIHLKQIGK